MRFALDISNIYPKYFHQHDWPLLYILGHYQALLEFSLQVEHSLHMFVTSMFQFGQYISILASNLDLTFGLTLHQLSGDSLTICKSGIWIPTAHLRSHFFLIPTSCYLEISSLPIFTSTTVSHGYTFMCYIHNVHLVLFQSQ